MLTGNFFFFFEKKREEVNLGKIHRSIFELQVPRKGPHPILTDFTQALRTYQIKKKRKKTSKNLSNNSSR